MSVKLSKLRHHQNRQSRNHLLRQARNLHHLCQPFFSAHSCRNFLPLTKDDIKGISKPPLAMGDGQYLGNCFLFKKYILVSLVKNNFLHPSGSFPFL